MINIDGVLLLRGFAAFVLSIALLVVAIIIIVKLARVFWKAIRDANTITKILAIIGASLVVIVIGIAIFWVSMILLILVSGTSSLH